MAEYEAVIGLEIHVQLRTASKMFCRCDNNAEGATPNQHTCEVCLGFPGTLPVPNRRAVEWSLKTALALGCQIPAVSKFDRKQYFYPDLPKGYQISQYDEPLGGPGKFEFDLIVEGKPQPRSVGITRLHLEEDAGKLTHPPGAAHSLVDLNRAGTPLMEIVTEPDLRSPAEAKTFLQELRLLMRQLGVSDADMEKGHLRADANVSLRPPGQKKLGIKTELKNLNSFKFVEKGLAAEIERQTAALDVGETIAQETRGFDEQSGKTVSQRSKEEAQDYRYFPEPDIPPLEPPQLGLDNLKAELPELPVTRRRRWRQGYPELAEEVLVVAGEQLPESDAFDRLLTETKHATAAGKLWLTLRRQEGFHNGPAKLAEFVAEVAPLVADGTVSAAQTKPAASQFLKTGRIEFAATDTAELSAIIKRAVADNPKAVADFKGGNQNAANVIVGAAMKQTKGSANPTTVKSLVAECLEHL